MKEIKERLKVLAALCIDNGLHFDCTTFTDAIFWCVYSRNSENVIKYISGISEIAAEWKDESIKKINEVIAKVEAL